MSVLCGLPLGEWVSQSQSVSRFDIIYGQWKQYGVNMNIEMHISMNILVEL